MHFPNTLKMLYVSMLLAAIIPFATRGGGRALTAVPFPGWPTTFQGHELSELPLTEQERGFTRDFPGKIARFTDGKREILMRWVSQETRKLHPAMDCFRGTGHSVVPTQVRLDSDRKLWGCFNARKDNSQLEVCEQIFDSAGNSWSDTSAWFWNAALNRTSGPWWSITVATNQSGRTS